MWGLSAADAEASVCASASASDWHVAAIGPAGERGVRYATSPTTAATPAAAGSARCWAPRTSRRSRCGPRREGRARRPGRRCSPRPRTCATRSFGPATEKYRELGTVANLLAFNALATLPTRNFQAGTFERRRALAAEDLADCAASPANSCAACTIGCEHIYKRRTGGKATRVEYENVFALGPLCGVSDPDAVLEASARCDALGLDTISAGGTIAFAMECAERGLIDAPWLRFGDGGALLRALDEIAARDRASASCSPRARAPRPRVVGQGSRDFAPHVKGLELPGYEPRALQTMALGLAVGARGADHNRSGAYEADLAGDRTGSTAAPAHVAAAIETEDRAAVMDSLILCKFLRGVFDRPSPSGPAAQRGHRLGRRRRGAARRPRGGSCWPSARSTCARAGRRAEDWLPERFLDEPLEVGSGRRAALTAGSSRDDRGYYDGARASTRTAGRSHRGRADPTRSISRRSLATVVQQRRSRGKRASTPPPRSRPSAHDRRPPGHRARGHDDLDGG